MADRRQIFIPDLTEDQFDQAQSLAAQKIDVKSVIRRFERAARNPDEGERVAEVLELVQGLLETAQHAQAMGKLLIAQAKYLERAHEALRKAAGK